MEIHEDGIFFAFMCMILLTGGFVLGIVGAVGSGLLHYLFGS